MKAEKRTAGKSVPDDTLKKITPVTCFGELIEKKKVLELLNRKEAGR